MQRPVYPNTWVTLKTCVDDKVVKVRTSQLVPIGGHKFTHKTSPAPKPASQPSTTRKQKGKGKEKGKGKGKGKGGASNGGGGGGGRGIGQRVAGGGKAPKRVIGGQSFIRKGSEQQQQQQQPSSFSPKRRRRSSVNNGTSARTADPRRRLATDLEAQASLQMAHCQAILLHLWAQLFPDTITSLTAAEQAAIPLTMRNCTLVDPRGLRAVYHQLVFQQYRTAIACIGDVRRLFRNSYRRRSVAT